MTTQQDKELSSDLPPLPEAIDDVRCMIRGDTGYATAMDEYYTRGQMVAYGKACATSPQLPVAGVVLRNGLPTLLRNEDIKSTDIRLYAGGVPVAEQPAGQAVAKVIDNSKPYPLIELEPGAYLPVGTVLYDAAPHSPVAQMSGEPEWHKEALDRCDKKLASVWKCLSDMIEEHTGKPCSSEPFDDLAAIFAASHRKDAVIPAEFDVRTMLKDVVPGADGMGQEVYFKTVEEVVQTLTDMSEKLDDASHKNECGNPSNAVQDAPDLSEIIRKKNAEIDALGIPMWTYATPDSRDARRYRRLQVLGAAPFGSDELEHGNVLRFTNLDVFVDGDIAAHPSRGESAATAPQVVQAPSDELAQAEKIIKDLLTCFDDGVGSDWNRDELDAARTFAFRNGDKP